MSTAPRAAHLVVHTHWDREWYLPFNRFRVHLVEVVDRVLDALDNDPDVPHFLLDGQTAVLQDYLTAKPESRDRVNRLVREGRLTVGPWYILPDEFLVSGEATARNLLQGRLTAPLGRHHAVGYMPDSFGHIAQMPQILQLAGLDNFVFTRGLDNRADEAGWLFRWQGPDGSEVLAVNQCGGYDNGAGLGLAEMWHAHTQRTVEPDHAVQQVRELFSRMATRPGHEPALINNGGDHLGPQRETGAVLAALREAFPDTTFTPSTLAGYLAAARAEMPDEERPVIAGELLGGRDHLILSGIWSARMPLKQLNEECQNLLCRVVEPLHAAAWAVHGAEWPGGLLDVAWTDLLRNHPHDSIGGCSTDSVAADMETRFAAVRQTGEQMTARLLNRWAPNFARQEEGDRQAVLCVANPLPQRRTEVVERLVVVPPGGVDPARMKLLDDDGKAVPFEVVKLRYLERFWGVDYRAELYATDQFALLDTYLHRFGHRIIGTEADKGSHDTFVHLRFLARDLPAVGHANFRLSDEATPAAQMPPPVTVTRGDGQAILVNEHLQAILHGDGTIDLTERATGHTYLGLNLLEDTEDIGDEYDYCPCDPNRTVFSGGNEGKIRLAESSALRAVAATTFRFDLPRSLDQDRLTRHSRTTPCDVTVEVVLNAGARRLEICTTFNNRAFDHRLRAWFPSGLVTEEVVSDGQFMLNWRPISRPTDEAWPQPAPPTWPQQDFSYLSDGTHGLAVFNRGLPEFETLGSGDGTVIYAMTLLRSVDWLSRDDFPSRKNTNAGPTLFTPGAQGIGRQNFHYAVMPCGPDIFAADVKAESEAYRVVPPVTQGVTDGLVSGGHSLVHGTDSRVAITAIKKAVRGDVLIIRLYNQADTAVTETLHFGTPVIDADKVSLVESELHIFRDDPVITHGGRQVRVPLAPCEIATLALSLEQETT